MGYYAHFLVLLCHDNRTAGMSDYEWTWFSVRDAQPEMWIRERNPPASAVFGHNCFGSDRIAIPGAGRGL
jgi:hypothetical protein